MSVTVDCDKCGRATLLADVIVRHWESVDYPFGRSYRQADIICVDCACGEAKANG